MKEKLIILCCMRCVQKVLRLKMYLQRQKGTINITFSSRVIPLTFPTLIPVAQFAGVVE